MHSKAEMPSTAYFHADETPVAMLKPFGNGKTHRLPGAYALGAFEEMRAVVYDFCESRGGCACQGVLGRER